MLLVAVAFKSPHKEATDWIWIWASTLEVRNIKNEMGECISRFCSFSTIYSRRGKNL